MVAVVAVGLRHASGSKDEADQSQMIGGETTRALTRKRLWGCLSKRRGCVPGDRRPLFRKTRGGRVSAIGKTRNVRWIGLGPSRERGRRDGSGWRRRR